MFVAELRAALGMASGASNTMVWIAEIRQKPARMMGWFRGKKLWTPLCGRCDFSN